MTLRSLSFFSEHAETLSELGLSQRICSRKRRNRRNNYNGYSCSPSPSPSSSARSSSSSSFLALSLASECVASRKISLIYILYSWVLLMTYVGNIEAKIGYFWHITDLHLDSFYTTQGDVLKSCWHIEHHQGGSSAGRTPGRFGDYLCDSPWSLLESATLAMKAKQGDNVEFVLWTGDGLSHSAHRLFESHRLDTLRNITDLLGRTFSSQFVFPVLGHEDGSNTNFERLGELWRHWLPLEALQTFEKGGYYTIEQKKTRLRIIALNTNFMRHDPRYSQSQLAAVRQRQQIPMGNGAGGFTSTEYKNFYYHHGSSISGSNHGGHYHGSLPDSMGYGGGSGGASGINRNADGSAGGQVSALSGYDNHETQKQWDWLEDVLIKSNRNKELVYIVGHIPPGSDERLFGVQQNGHTTFSEKNNLRYLRLVRKYSSIIQGQFFGHLHSDSFRIIYNEMGKPVSWIMISPSISPRKMSVGSNNPAMRLYKFDTDSGQVLDYTQYYLDLSAANREGEANWQPEYNLTTYYFGLSEISAISLHNLADRFTNYENPAFAKYYRANSVRHSTKPCEAACSLNHYCAITRVDYREFRQCLETAASALSSHSSSSLILYSMTSSSLHSFTLLASILLAFWSSTHLLIQGLEDFIYFLGRELRDVILERISHLYEIVKYNFQYIFRRQVDEMKNPLRGYPSEEKDSENDYDESRRLMLRIKSSLRLKYRQSLRLLFSLLSLSLFSLSLSLLIDIFSFWSSSISSLLMSFKTNEKVTELPLESSESKEHTKNIGDDNNSKRNRFHNRTISTIGIRLNYSIICNNANQDICWLRINSDEFSVLLQFSNLNYARSIDRSIIIVQHNETETTTACNKLSKVIILTSNLKISFNKNLSVHEEELMPQIYEIRDENLRSSRPITNNFRIIDFSNEIIAIKGKTISLDVKSTGSLEEAAASPFILSESLLSLTSLRTLSYFKREFYKREENIFNSKSVVRFLKAQEKKQKAICQIHNSHNKNNSNNMKTILVINVDSDKIISKFEIYSQMRLVNVICNLFIFSLFVNLVMSILAAFYSQKVNVNQYKIYCLCFC